MTKASHKAIKEALAKIATITVDIQPEDMAPDTDDNQWIYDQLASGNDYAWCCVVVKATWGGFTGHDSLGGCSYESRASLEQGIADHGMRDEALLDLTNRVCASYDAISKLIVGGK
jgi:hypothetical protein